MADPTVGLVLAAGAGSRFAMPKALARRRDGGCSRVHGPCAVDCTDLGGGADVDGVPA